MRDKMNCKEIENLIYLKPEELEPGEIKELEKHLLNCESCRLNYNRQHRVNEFVNKLAQSAPANLLEGELTTGIMSKISVKEKTKWIDRFIELLNAPKLRYAMVVMLFFISGYYFYEEGRTVISITNLEKRNEQFTRQVNYSGYSIDEAKIVKYFPEIISFIGGKQNYAELSDDLILMNKEGLKDLLSYSMFLENIKSSMPEEFSKKYPDLAEAIKSGAANKLFNMQGSKKEKILNELNKLFSEGDK